MEWALVKEIIGTGGNGAMIAVAFYLWRLDRRMVVVEEKVKFLSHRVFAKSQEVPK